MDDLIAQLEAAADGSDELDEAVALAVGWTMRQAEYGDLWHEPGMAGHVEQQRPPSFTTSLDAALMLVPEGTWWNLSQFAGTTGSGASCYMAEVIRGGHKDDSRFGEKTWGTGTPAIAICIAALKARNRDANQT